MPAPGRAASQRLDHTEPPSSDCDPLPTPRPGARPNWINNDVQYGLEWPELEFNLEKARQLMREAGHPNGFTVDWTPLAPFYSRGERVVAQLQAIGVRAKLQFDNDIAKTASGT